jgi:hypothetical protein
MPKTNTKKKKINKNKRRTKRRKQLKKKQRQRRRTEKMFGISQIRLMRPNTPESVKTPSPKTRKSPNSVTPNLVPLSQRSPRVSSLKTPVPQSASPLSIIFTNSGPGGMGPNLKDIRDCYLINNEQECGSNEKCKWNQKEQKCHLKPIPFNLTN